VTDMVTIYRQLARPSMNLVAARSGDPSSSWLLAIAVGAIRWPPVRLGPHRLGTYRAWTSAVAGPRSPGHARQPPPERMSWTASSGWSTTAGWVAAAGCWPGSAWELAGTARSRTVARTATATATAALSPAVSCSPWVNAWR